MSLGWEFSINGQFLICRTSDTSYLAPWKKFKNSVGEGKGIIACCLWFWPNGKMICFCLWHYVILVLWHHMETYWILRCYNFDVTIFMSELRRRLETIVCRQHHSMKNRFNFPLGWVGWWVEMWRKWKKLDIFAGNRGKISSLHL